MHSPSYNCLAYFVEWTYFITLPCHPQLTKLALPIRRKYFISHVANYPFFSLYFHSIIIKP